MDIMERDLMKSLIQMAVNGPIIYMSCIFTEHNQRVNHLTPNVERIFGYAPEQLLSGEIPLFSLIHEDDRKEFNETLLNQISKKSQMWESFFRIYSGCGHVKSIKAYTYIDSSQDCDGTTLNSYILDQTFVQQEIDLQISLEQQRWATAIDSAREGVWDTNPQTQEVFFSKHWKGMLGYEDDEFPNEYGEWVKRVHPNDMKEINSIIKKHVDNETNFYESKYRLLHKDGSYRWILGRGKAVERDEKGIATRMIGTHVDITEQIEMKQLLKKRNEELVRLVEHNKNLAITDPLTTLYNRRKMMEEIKQASQLFDLTGETFTLAILDLDHFKAINDKYGHTFGDIALQTFANLLKRKIKHPNVIARWGGEEFILLFPDKNMLQTKRILTSLQACCNEELLKYRTESVMLSFSAGVCEYNNSEIQNKIIKNADQALYLAKELGRNQITLYKEGLPAV